MAVSRTRTYAPNYMQPWTAWFRARQEDLGTVEDFARASGIGVRTVATYRAGTIPRRRDQLEKLAKVFEGDLGPLPGSDQAVDLEERLERLEISTIVMKASMADVLRAAITALAKPGLSDRERAEQQEILNHALELWEPTPDDLLRIVESAEDQADGAGPRPVDERGEDDAQPGRSA